MESTREKRSQRITNQYKVNPKEEDRLDILKKVYISAATGKFKYFVYFYLIQFYVHSTARDKYVAFGYHLTFLTCQR